MGLFDSLEDVYDIQLTQYGKRMLQLGKFMPDSYSFCDDDILYDALYAGLTENQNDAQDRILTTSVSRKAQSLHYGIETEFKNSVSKLKDGEIYLNEVQPEHDRTYSSISVLGNSSLNNQYRPAWKLIFGAGQISSSLQTITGSISDIRIPQVNLKDTIYDINYITGLPSDLMNQLSAQNFEVSTLDNEIEELPRGDIIEVVNQDIFINLEEINALARNDTFEIEVFLVEQRTNVDASTSDKLIPLYFNQKSFKKDAIYDDEEFFQSSTGNEVDSSMVEYYINIESDYEIPNDILCRYVVEDHRKGIYGKFLKCPDRSITLNSKYQSDADVDDEECDD